MWGLFLNFFKFIKITDSKQLSRAQPARHGLDIKGVLQLGLRYEAPTLKVDYEVCALANFTFYFDITTHLLDHILANA